MARRRREHSQDSPNNSAHLHGEHDDDFEGDALDAAFPPDEDMSVRNGRRSIGNAQKPENILSKGIAFFAESKEEREARSSGRKGPSYKTAHRVRPSNRASQRQRMTGGKRTQQVMMSGMVIGSLVMSTAAFMQAQSKLSTADAQATIAEEMRTQGKNFPVGEAVAWADQAAIDWATFDETNAESHKIRMAQYLTDGMDEQAGWNGLGKQTVTFTSVNPVPRVIDEHHAIVDVDYRIEDGSRRCVSVPVYAYASDTAIENVQWAFALSSNPVPRACSPRTGASKPVESQDESNLQDNAQLGNELTTTFFPGFFAAWGSSDMSSLRQYTASGVRVIGLGGAMSSTPMPSITSTKIMTPDGDSAEENKVYQAKVSVRWTLAGSSAQVTGMYDVPMKMIGDRWYVAGEPQPTVSNPEVSSSDPAAAVDPAVGGAQNPEPSSGASAKATGK